MMLSTRLPESGLVAIGGATGATLRYLLTLALPTPFDLPLATFTENVLGAFALGFLLELITNRLGQSARIAKRLRLLIGTGVLGGFTTYSSFALETIRLLQNGRITAAIVYAGFTLLAGTLAAVAGVTLAARGASRRRRPTE